MAASERAVVERPPRSRPLAGGAATSRRRLASAAARRAAAAAAIKAARSHGSACFVLLGTLIALWRRPMGARGHAPRSCMPHPAASPNHAAPRRARRRAAVRRRARALRLGALQQAVRHGGGARQPAHPRGVLEAVPEAGGERKRWVVARLHGCTAARLHGCTAARLHGCTAARLHGCTAARLHGCTAARLHGCTAGWLYGCARARGSLVHPPLVRLPGLLAPGDHVPGPRQGPVQGVHLQDPVGQD
jgi:hypothetical protein